MFVRNDAFASELRGHLHDAIKQHGRRVQQESHRRRPTGTRILTWMAYALIRIALFISGKRY